jgi:Mn2+ and Fe2+ transporters of the NRAMP family
VLRSTFIPHVEYTSAFWATLVGILGTTISPYLFFWQSAQEVEEERAMGRLTVEEREGATRANCGNRATTSSRACSFPTL